MPESNDFNPRTSNDFSATLNAWMDSVENAVNPSVLERTEINLAGAKAYQTILQKEARSKHYDSHSKRRKDKKGVERPHIADSVNVSKGRAKTSHGSVDVGFDDKVGYIARFLNDGTKKMPADHFVDNARQQAIPFVIEAQKQAYDLIMRSKQ